VQCHPSPSITAPAALVAAASPATAPRRRRLWQLPPQAHELLLAMSFAPEVLRRQAARTLGQMHRGVCNLRGRDVDVLYSVAHDLVIRNPLSEAFQKRLDAAHAHALRRFAALREAEALQQAWVTALAEDQMAGALWALLTHPLGSALETKALYDARAWVFAHGRRSVDLARREAQDDQRLQDAERQAAELRHRLLAQQQQSAQALAQAQAEIARLNGALARGQTADGLQPPQRPCTPRMRTDTQEAPAAPAPVTSAERPALPVSTAPPQAQREALPPPVPAPAPAPQPITVHGRRVLCVGGIQHAVARYRGRIEKLGGHFEHHDGGLEDSVQALEGRLRRADLVICQAACINHEAYHRIKRHCERTGTPCMCLDRPSLSRLDRALAQPLAHRPTAGPATDRRAGGLAPGF
jgi:Uncharacterized protein conserved in bacteria (DUF2325)